MLRGFALIFLIIISYVAGTWMKGYDTNIDPPSFTLGASFIIILGAIAFLARVWWAHVTESFRPQAIVHLTERTPAQVMFGAYLWLFGGVALLGLICVLGSYWLSLVWK